MKVKVRHIEQPTDEAVLFTDIHFSELDNLIALVKRSQGFFDADDCKQIDFNSCQLVMTEGEAFAEIILSNTND